MNRESSRKTMRPESGAPCAPPSVRTSRRHAAHRAKGPSRTERLLGSITGVRSTGSELKPGGGLVLTFRIKLTEHEANRREATRQGA